MTAAPNLDYLLLERVLSGALPIEQLNRNEQDFYHKYKPAFEVGRLAHRMAQGYYAHTAAIEIAKGPHAKALVSQTPLGELSSYVARKDGTQHTFDLPYYLGQTHSNPGIADELLRVWLVGSLLAVGDALGAPKNRYFDHAPVLELLYHLRNGVAHGNVFRFTYDGKKRLSKYPAHNKAAGVRSVTKSAFEIVEGLEGQTVLFDYMGPGDILDLLQSVEVYLTRIRERHAKGELSGLLR